jgi:putative transposase
MPPSATRESGDFVTRTSGGCPRSQAGEESGVPGSWGEIKAWHTTSVPAAFFRLYVRHFGNKGSANRAKARAKVARAHRKVRNARRDFLHRASTRLIRDNDVIVIEDLAVRNMVRNRHLARVISDCGWGEFRRQLEYKCQRARRDLIVIDRWYPSSKACSACGHLLGKLSLSTRHWTCPSCGSRHDRDVNAAKNILAAGQAVTACGAGVRRSGTSRVRPAVKQEPQSATAGIPVLQGGE